MDVIVFLKYKRLIINITVDLIRKLIEDQFLKLCDCNYVCQFIQIYQFVHINLFEIIHNRICLFQSTHIWVCLLQFCFYVFLAAVVCSDIFMEFSFLLIPCTWWWWCHSTIFFFICESTRILGIDNGFISHCLFHSLEFLLLDLWIKSSPSCYLTCSWEKR